MRITLGRPHLSLEIDAYRRKQKKIIVVRRGYQSLEQLRTELNSSERTRTVLSMVLTSRGPITNYPGA
jgi:ABC-type thiamine transport system ATPase subunit